MSKLRQKILKTNEAEQALELSIYLTHERCKVARTKFTEREAELLDLGLQGLVVASEARDPVLFKQAFNVVVMELSRIHDRLDETTGAHVMPIISEGDQSLIKSARNMGMQVATFTR